MISPKTIERLSLYRRLIADLQNRSLTSIYSHQLASLSHTSPAQVRRDLMTASISGSSSKGYDLNYLRNRFDAILSSSVQKAALIGIGNLGRAILSYFPHRSPAVEIVAAFDTDTAKVNRVIHGCRTWPADQMPSVIADKHITLAIITTPKDAAQAAADAVVAAGIRGILNFAPVPIRVPDSVFLESLDLTTSLEKLAYFAGKTA